MLIKYYTGENRQLLDFHTHILPGMDDGSKSPEMSLNMLIESAKQGVTSLVLTSHFYADEEYPDTFLKRRARAVQELSAYTEEFRQRNNFRSPLPALYLGAEVYYFPSMSYCEELPKFKITSTDYVLVEPLMQPWRDEMLDEIEQAGINFGFMPVIAHVDRFMVMLDDFSLFDRILNRRMLIQVNADFFLYPVTTKYALNALRQGKIRFVGSDCHNLTSRPQKMGAAAQVAADAGLVFPEF